jgi:acyl-coenzyme A thioesterase PaaI-like protein
VSEAVQDRYAPSSICFGCGPANEEGLRIKSFRDAEGLRMAFQPQAQHQAFPGVINGGIIGALLDCHGNWTAAITIMDRLGLEQPLCTVTAQYEVKLRRPTPFGPALEVRSRVLVLEDDRAEIMLELKADGETCATGRGLFVAVREGHPAWHRWG